KLSRPGVYLGEPGEGVVEVDQVIGRSAIGHHARKVKALAWVSAVSTSLESPAVPGAGHQDSTHRLCRGATEVAPAVPELARFRSDQANVRLVDQGGRLECLVGSLASQAGSGEPTQLIIHKGQQPLGRAGLAAPDGFEYPRHVGAGIRPVLLRQIHV